MFTQTTFRFEDFRSHRSLDYRPNPRKKRLTYASVNLRSLVPSMDMAVAELYNHYKDEDGFLYITYASTEMFG